jgi:hypothetical protein
MRVTADDPRLSWEGAVSLQRDGAGVKPWRIPYAERGLFPQTLAHRLPDQLHPDAEGYLALGRAFSRQVAAVHFA